MFKACYYCFNSFCFKIQIQDFKTYNSNEPLPRYLPFFQNENDTGVHRRGKDVDRYSLPDL